MDDPRVVAVIVVTVCFLVSGIIAGFAGYRYGRLEERARWIARLQSTVPDANEIVRIMRALVEGEL